MRKFWRGFAYADVGGHNKMKRIKNIAILIILLFLINNAFGTAQMSDGLIYKGETFPICVRPLEFYFANHPRPNMLNSGYSALWELVNDSLFLIRVSSAESFIDLSLIFKDRKKNNRVFADWFSYSISNPHGKMLFREFWDCDPVHEYERLFIFKNGLLSETINFDNSKSKKSKYTQNPGLLYQYIKESIDYSNITSNFILDATVYVQILSVTESGKIDSVQVIQGLDREKDAEAVRVVKSIPEWDVLYNRGKMFTSTWTISVKFGLKIRMR